MSCSSGNPTIAGTVTETQNSGLIKGKIVDGNGNPAEGVKVIIVSADNDPSSGNGGVIDSCYTDKNGEYSVDTIPEGTYNFFASGNSDETKLYIDSVKYAGETLFVEEAALLPPGSIQGKIRLQQGDDPRYATVNVIGAIVYSLPENDGAFQFSSLAKGLYRLRIRTNYSDKYDILDTLVRVNAAARTLIDSPITIPLKIPTPTGLSYFYDTLKQAVTLQWTLANPKKVSSYNIYRRRVDTAESELKLNTLPFASNIYIDSATIQDAKYLYRVASVDSMGNEGYYKASFIDTITISTAFKLITSFGGAGSGDGKFTEISDVKVLRDGRVLVVDYGAHKVSLFDSLGTFLFSWGRQGEGNGEFVCPIAATEDDSGYIYVLEFLGAGRVQKFTSSGAFVRSYTIGQTNTGIAYKNGALYFVSSFSNQLKKLNITTSDITVVGSTNYNMSKISASPNGSCFAVSVDDNNKLLVLDLEGAVQREFGTFGSQKGQFNGIGNLAINKREVYITDKRNGRIQVIDTMGNYITKLDLPVSNSCTARICQEFQPTGTSLGFNGDLFVSNRYSVFKYKNRKYE